MNQLKTKYLQLVKENPIYFGLKAGFDDLIDIHNEWIKSFLLAKEDRSRMH